MRAQTSFEDLVNAVIGAESSGRPSVRGKKGEIGLMQIMPKTAGDYGITDPNRLLNPKTNKDVGSRYLTDLLKHYKGDLTKALEAYNAGRGRVDKGKIPASAITYANKVESRLGGDTKKTTLRSLRGEGSIPTVGSQTPRFSPNMMETGVGTGGGLGAGILRALSPASASAADTLEIPRVGPPATRGIPIPHGATVGSMGKGIPIPPGATVGAPSKTPMSMGEGIAGAITGKAIGANPVAAADYLPLIGQTFGSYAGEAVGTAGSPLLGPAAPAGPAIGAGIGGGAGEFAGEEMDTGVRALMGQPYRSQSEILKNAGIAGGANALMTGPAMWALRKAAPSTLKAAITAKQGWQASREALEGTLSKVRDLLGMDAKAAGVAVATPAERRAVRAAYVGARQAGFENLGSRYDGLLGKYIGRFPPSFYSPSQKQLFTCRASAAYSEFSAQHGAHSLPLLAGNAAIPKGVDFTQPSPKMIQLFRSNVRKAIRRLAPDQRAMKAELFKMERAATHDIKTILNAPDGAELDEIDATYSDFADNLPEKQLRAVMRGPNSAKAIEPIIKAEPSAVATLLDQLPHLSPAKQIEAQFATKKAIGEWIHDQAASAPDYVSALKAYRKAVNDVPDIAWNRLYWAGSKQAMMRAAEETVKFHEKMLNNPEMIPAIIAAMRARPTPWFVERAKSLGIRGAEWGLIYGVLSGDFRESGVALVVGFTPTVLHKIANNPLTEKLYLKMVTAKTAPAIGAALRDLAVAMVAQEFRGPVRDEDGKPVTVTGP